LSAKPQSWQHSDFVDAFPNGNRGAPRCEVRLRISLRFSPSSTGTEGTGSTAEPAEMIGETRNLSEKGLAICVPSNRIDRRYLNVVGGQIDLALQLPTGTVQMRATPLWCKKSLDQQTSAGYLIGLRITEMSDQEWVSLVRYVHSFL
jgi:hypothetical protein